MSNLQTKQYIGQIKALEKCREGGRRGTLLNCGMGTGKTRMAIEWMKELLANVPSGRTLVTVIACPVALLPEPKAINPGGWMGQFRQWYGDTLPVLYMGRKGTTRERVKEMVDLCKQHASGNMAGVPLVLAQSYDSWRQPEMARLLSSIGNTGSFVRLLICDESHRCKNPTSQTTKTMHKFADKCDYTLLLTGTPMPHTPLDVWAQAYMCDVKAYGGSYFAFRGKYAIMRQLEGRGQMFVGMKKNMLPEFKSRFDTLAYTLTVEDALDLPPITHNILHVTLGDREQKAYDQMKKQLMVEVQNMKDSNDITAANILSQISKLSQITGGSIKDEAGNTHILGSGKATAVKELLVNDIPESEPVVVFCRYRADMDRVSEACKAVNREVMELSGRKKELEKWRSDSSGSVLIVQESAGGVGVELQRAHYVIYFSVNYSLGDFQQSIARLHRAGQTMPVTAVHLIAPGTIDEVIRDSIDKKRSIVDAALGYVGLDLERDTSVDYDWSELWEEE